MPSTIVFLGPSLELETAKEIFPAGVFLPPIKRGDVDKLLQEEIPGAIGIIDGQFFQQFSISPKEILKALKVGVRVYGASSMGVLRAVELSRYGMKGIGDVFELYTSGVVDADDEVAVIYDGENKRAMSVPLVNMRLAFKAAREANHITSDTELRLIKKAKDLYYPKRNYDAIIKLVVDEVPQQEIENLRKFLNDKKPDAKRDDAISLLKLMRYEDEITNQL